MSRITTILLLVLFLPLFCIAQNTKNTQDQIDEYLELSTQYLASNSDTLFFYLGKIEKLNLSVKVDAQKNNQANVNFMLGRYYNYEKDHRTADSLLNVSLKLFEETKDKGGMAKTKNQQGTSQRYQSYYSDAFDLFDEAEALYKELGDDEGVANINSNRGIAYDYMGQYPTSLEYQLKAIEYFESVKDTAKLTKCYLNLAAIYDRSNLLKKAVSYYKKSEDYAITAGDVRTQVQSLGNSSVLYMIIGKQDSAFLVVNKAIEMAKKQGFKYLEADYVTQLGTLHYYKGDYKKALAVYEAAAELVKTYDIEKEKVVSNHYNQALALAELKRYGEALANLDKAIKIADQYQLPSQKINPQGFKSEIHRRRNNYKKAYDNYVKYIEARDSIYNSKTTKQIANLELKYETAKKDKVIAQAQAQNLQQQQKINKLIALSIAIFLGLLGALYLRRLSNKARRLEQEKNQELQKSIELKQANHLLLKISEERLLRENQYLIERNEALEDKIQNVVSPLHQQINIKGKIIDLEELIYTEKYSKTDRNNRAFISEDNRKTCKIRITNKELEGILPADRFARINNSNFVNIFQIKEVKSSEIILSNSVTLKLSDEQKKTLRQKMKTANLL